MFLSDKRESIKKRLLAADPELKGKELHTSIVKTAAAMWKARTDEQKLYYDEKQAAAVVVYNAKMKAYHDWLDDVSQRPSSQQLIQSVKQGLMSSKRRICVL